MSAPPTDPSASLEAFGPAAREWFAASFERPTPVQSDGWKRIAAGEHALLIAPTGSGKTLAAFFYCIDRLTRLPEAAPPGVRVLYVSPLKALVYDIERNLRAPLDGIRRQSSEPLNLPRVAVRTGDTPARERRQQGRDPAEILVTTPESLYLILGSQQRETLASVETVIVDEIHALAPTKRGAHLALSLERVAALAEGDPQRVGLSATARPLDEVARFLGGDRPVAIVDTSVPPQLDLAIQVPVPDMTRPELGAPTGEAAAEDAAGLWPAIYPRLLDAIQAHQSTIVFTNSRGLCERLAHKLNELAGDELVRAHHGSVAHDKRREIEESLKSGTLRGIVATSSLELGIDMGAVDLVLLVESPGSVARGLQRVGRAGHRVGDPSRGWIFPKHRGDLLEATVVADGMSRGDVEPIRIPHNPLDVLAQQIVAMSSVEKLEVSRLEGVLRRTASFRELSREMLHGVLDMLAGRYPSTDFAELRARLHWDREADVLEARKGAKQLAILSGGTIPDRGLYAVHLGASGPRIGELDEEMVHETRAGEAVTLGASTWRVEEITRDRVVVSPAPGRIGKLPFWRGDGPGRPLELGRALGRFVAELAAECGLDLHAGRARGEAWLRDRYRLDAHAARNLVAYVVGQQEATGTLPTDASITVERFRDELGDWRICILSPFGTRLHAPWSLAIDAKLSAATGSEMQTLWSDDGIVLRFADAERLPELGALFPDPDEVEDQVVSRLEGSALFAGQFRENAARSLLLPRRRPGMRTPLWTQRLRAQNLLAVAREFPSFPIVLETYRSCLQDVFDLPGLVELLRDVREHRVRVDEVETRTASPFARSLVFAYTAAYLYQGDTPVAERRAQALTLDRNMLRDLLGQEDLRDLLDADVIAEIEDELQARAQEYRARHVDGLHDLLRRIGDLSRTEIEERCDGDVASWLSELEVTRRGVRVEIAGQQRWIAAEDAALYRDAVGAAPPAGLPPEFLEAVPRPLEQLLSRHARRRGPFSTEAVASRYAVLPAQLEPALEALVARDRLLLGEFHPDGVEREWCEPEVLRRLRRRTLAMLRGEVAPVETRTLARFLPRWHGVGDERGGESRLRAALDQLEGVPISFAELERLVLPARIPDYDPRMLDELGAHGQLVWIGAGAIGERDGRVALYRRDRVALLADPPETPSDLDPLSRAVLDHLNDRGACFLHELAGATGNPGQKELLEALWVLVWAGLVTNDTFAALRALSTRRESRPRRRPRRGSGVSAAVGRWSSVALLLDEPVEPTRRAHARALSLLERYGVVSRDAMANEAIVGGFSAVYGVYREMEESGKLRRGHFVDALTGAQFAYAGAVDRLRAARGDALSGEVAVLAATDPANPFGVLAPWPETRAEGGAPRRAVGATLVLVGGEPALYLDRGGQRVLSFAPGDPSRADEVMKIAAGALRRLFLSRSRGILRLEQIDGEPARRSPLADVLVKQGFRADYKGLTLDRFDAIGE